MTPIRDITIRNLRDVFFEMEINEELFSMKMSDGTYYWDVVRRDVYLRLHTIHRGLVALPSIRPAASLKAVAKDLLKPLINRVSSRYLANKASPYLFVTIQRARQGVRLVDHLSDRAYDLLEADSAAIELMNRSAINYGRLLVGGRTRVPAPAVRTPHKNAELTQAAEHIERTVFKYFGFEADLCQVVGDAVVSHKESREYYLRLFSRYRPRVVFSVNNGTLSGLFSAAKDHDIPTVEFQHGASCKHTIFWSYPESIKSAHPGLSLPTAYFTFSDYWNDNTHYPVKSFRTIGNDYFHREPSAGVRGDLLIISSYVYRDALLKLVLELADLDKGRKIYFKLHFHEFDKKNAVVGACAGKENIIVIGDGKDVLQMFAECEYVVGVQSTAIYMALQARKKVCLLRISDYFYHEDIFEFVELFDTAEELYDITHAREGVYFKNQNTIPELSQPFSVEKFMRAVQDVETANLP